MPRRLTGIGACFDAASALIEAAEAEAAASVADSDARERAALETALGAGGTGRGAAGAIRGAAGQLKDLETPAEVPGHPGPARRAGPGAGRPGRLLPRRAGHQALRRAGAAGARRHRRRWPPPPPQKWTPESTLRRLEAVLACRDAIEANVKPRIAVEAMMLDLWRG